jgi:hypothetical protein
VSSKVYSATATFVIAETPNYFVQRMRHDSALGNTSMEKNEPSMFTPLWALFTVANRFSWL